MNYGEVPASAGMTNPVRWIGRFQLSLESKCPNSRKSRKGISIILRIEIQLLATENRLFQNY
jgi:hypothetical protein